MSTQDPYRRNPARDVEQFAIEVVSSWVGNLGAVTDTSAGHEPDFRIDYHDGRLAIGEVGWHEDPTIQAMWSKTFAQERHQVVPLEAGSGMWSLGLQAGASIKRLYADLPSMINSLRGAGLAKLDVYGAWPRTTAGDEARRLGISYISLHDPAGPPEAVYFMPSTGGTVPPDAECIVDWVEEVLSSAHYADTTEKLLSRSADERHVFIMSGSASSFGVGERLTRLDQALPTRDPILPDGISHVWVVGRYGSRDTGLWVRGEGWRTVATRN